MPPSRTEIVTYFIEKVRDIVRPRVDPLDKLLVTCINEKAKSRILIGANRSCHCGQAERARCDYARARDGAVHEDAIRLVEISPDAITSRATKSTCQFPARS